MVDTLGLLWAVSVTAASVQDRDGALPLLRQIERLEEAEHPLEKVYTDGSYRGARESLVGCVSDWTLQIVEKPEGQKGFAVLPKRWIVERTFAWFGRYRLLNREYAHRVASSETDIYVASIRMMLARLNRCQPC